MRCVLLGVAAATVAVVAGCGSTTGGTAVADHSCTEVTAPMTAITTAADEPQLSIPQPEGWERRTELDSKIIRFVMVNKSLTADSFAANAVVTFETVNDSSQTPKQLLDGQRSNLEKQLKATDVKAEDSTQCGYPATLISYTPPPMGATKPPRPKCLGW